ncbi:MAG TPA: ABC transporter ATP-binding protein [Verrucomicrobiales bacterium]|nr:ABC transporter ATP-binding protein [Verrucomicrobiales bacterium]
MVFGVASVIAMLAIGEGANFEAQQQIQALGSQNIILRTIKPPEEASKQQRQGSYILDYGLKYEDVLGIRETISGITLVVEDRKERREAYHGRQNANIEMVGTVPWYGDLRQMTLTRGRFLTQRDLEQNAKVCVIEDSLEETLFPIHQVLGSSIRIGSQYFEVIGILKPPVNKTKSAKKSDSEEIEDADTPARVFIPITTAKRFFGETSVKRIGKYFQAEAVELHEVTLRVEKLEEVESIANAIKARLSQTHEKNDFEVVVPLMLMRQALRTKRIFNTVLGSIAGISLLVGGIGIMNIMLASVSERTREIGIRRALGATRKDILSQFMTETTLLASSGGLLGVSLGIMIPWIVGMLTNMVTIVTWWSPLLAFSVSAATGLIFGIYPANKAACLSPVEAVRQE